MNVVFDLGGVVVRWQPDVLIASVFDDAELRARVRREIIDHADWLALDRGVLEKIAAPLEHLLRKHRGDYGRTLIVIEMFCLSGEIVTWVDSMANSR